MLEYILLDLIGIVHRGGLVETPDNFFVRLRAGLNKLGKEHWEMCSALPGADPPIFIFKRRIPEILTSVEETCGQETESDTEQAIES